MLKTSRELVPVLQELEPQPISPEFKPSKTELGSSSSSQVVGVEVVVQVAERDNHPQKLLHGSEGIKELALNAHAVY